MDSTAIALCKDNNIPIMVFDIFKKGNISKAVAGESIGSLINKGGFGYPILASSLLFIIYYIISIIGEKSAKELKMDVDFGMWLSNLIFIPISVIAFIAANSEIRFVRYVK